VARRVIPLALVCLSLAACGGGGGGSHETTQATKAEQARIAHWSAGLRRWGAGMRAAINGLSVVFSSPADVEAIQAGSKRTRTILHRYETVLGACSAGVRRLGPAPARLVIARREALNACTSLERGAGLVRRGITQIENGLGVDLLSASSEPLGAGEDGVRRALLDLRPVSSSA
jgi:hypothetical protein